MTNDFLFFTRKENKTNVLVFLHPQAKNSSTSHKSVKFMFNGQQRTNDEWRTTNDERRTTNGDQPKRQEPSVLAGWLATADAAQQPAPPKWNDEREYKRDVKLSEDVQIQQVGSRKINILSEQWKVEGDDVSVSCESKRERVLFGREHFSFTIRESPFWRERFTFTILIVSSTRKRQKSYTSVSRFHV